MLQLEARPVAKRLVAAESLSSLLMKLRLAVYIIVTAFPILGMVRIRNGIKYSLIGAVFLVLQCGLLSLGRVQRRGCPVRV